MRPERAAIERWLREDLGHHDVVNDLPGTATGRIVAKEDGVAAGVEAATRVFEYLGVEAEATIESGETVDSGEPVLRVCGPTEQVLRGERVGVNLLGHASGIATKTRRAVEAVEAVDDSVRVAATRKTTPGLRGIEKRAVAAGGGDTHRLDLSHAAMIKDNHVARLGLKEAVERVRDRASFTTMIEVESETMEEAVRAAELGADIVLLDNMS
ncbi:MAG: carboxylating nicotinate-nucleotide diphosphorylase, partial [Natronomonas sp.]